MASERHFFHFLLCTVAIGVAACSGKEVPSDASSDATSQADARPDGGILDATDDVAEAAPPHDAPTEAAVDAKTEASTIDPPDAPIATCGGKGLNGSGGIDGSCSTGEQYACGVDKYEINCACPSAVCTCKKNGTVTGTVPFSSCPSCSTFPPGTESACGFPK